MNNPGMFRVFRRPEGKPPAHPKTRMALRKGLADIPLRAQVSADVNHRFMEHMATLRDDTPLRDVLRDLTRASFKVDESEHSTSPEKIRLCCWPRRSPIRRFRHHQQKTPADLAHLTVGKRRNRQTTLRPHQSSPATVP